MIQEAYVSFETAKLLKEKGFDCCCNVWYSEYTSQYGDGKYISIEFDNHNKFNENYKFVCFAPTIQMAMKWLREKHNLHIGVLINYQYLPRKYQVHIMHTEKCEVIVVNTGTNFNTNEEACEAAIKVCLENLI